MNFLESLMSCTMPAIAPRGLCRAEARNATCVRDLEPASSLAPDSTRLAQTPCTIPPVRNRSRVLGWPSLQDSNFGRVQVVGSSLHLRTCNVTHASRTSPAHTPLVILRFMTSQEVAQPGIPSNPWSRSALTAGAKNRRTRTTCRPRNSSHPRTHETTIFDFPTSAVLNSPPQLLQSQPRPQDTIEPLRP